MFVHMEKGAQVSLGNLVLVRLRRAFIAICDRCQRHGCVEHIATGHGHVLAGCRSAGGASIHMTPSSWSRAFGISLGHGLARSTVAYHKLAGRGRVHVDKGTLDQWVHFTSSHVAIGDDRIPVIGERTFGGHREFIGGRVGLDSLFAVSLVSSEQALGHVAAPVKQAIVVLHVLAAVLEHCAHLAQDVLVDVVLHGADVLALELNVGHVVTDVHRHPIGIHSLHCAWELL